MNETSQIVWQKWFDPLGEDDHETYPDIEDIDGVESAEYYAEEDDEQAPGYRCVEHYMCNPTWRPC